MNSAHTNHMLVQNSKIHSHQKHVEELRVANKQGADMKEKVCTTHVAEVAVRVHVSVMWCQALVLRMAYKQGYDDVPIYTSVVRAGVFG